MNRQFLLIIDVLSIVCIVALWALVVTSYYTGAAWGLVGLSAAAAISYSFIVAFDRR